MVGDNGQDYTGKLVRGGRRQANSKRRDQEEPAENPRDASVDTTRGNNSS